MIKCTLNYLTIDRNNGAITQEMDVLGAGQASFLIFLKEFMEKFFNEFYLGKVNKLEPGRPMMVSI